MCVLEQQHHFLWRMGLTSTPVPRTGSQSKRRDANIVHKQTLWRERGTLLEKLVSEILSNSETTLYILPCLACMPMFLAAVNTFSERVLSLGLHQWKNILHSGEKGTSMLRVLLKGSLSIVKSVTSSICLCICLWPDGLWSPLTSSLKVCSLQFLSGYIGFHHPLG